MSDLEVKYESQPSAYNLRPRESDLVSDLEVKYEVVTPAYAGGADRASTDGLRPPTLKALLRFWWRATKDALPQDLWAAESVLFGATGRGQGLRVVPTHRDSTVDPIPARPRYSGAEPLPLMAYGAEKFKDEAAPINCMRARVESGSTYSFDIYLPRTDWDRAHGRPQSVSPERRSQWLSEVAGAAWLLGVFGGFGSRCRRGFGALALTEPVGSALSLPDVSATKGQDQVCKALEQGLETILPAAFAGQTEHSAFCKGRRAFVGPKCNTPIDAVKQAGSPYHCLRRLLGANYMHNIDHTGYGRDFDAIWSFVSKGVVPGSASLGSAFGLPHNYQSSEPNPAPPPRTLEKWSARYDAIGPGAKQARRASPVLFSVIRAADGFFPVALWLPSQFLPAHGYQVQVTGRRWRPVHVNRPVSGVANPSNNAIAWLFNGHDVDRYDDVVGRWSTMRFNGLSQLGWKEVRW